MIKKILLYVLHLDRRQKKLLLIATDVIVLPLSMYTAYALKLGRLVPLEELHRSWWILFLFPLVTIPIYMKSGFYQSVLRYMGMNAVRATIESVTLAILIIGFLMMIVKDLTFPRSVLIIFWFVAIILTIGNRYLARWLLYTFTDRGRKDSKAVAIYGAGKAGAMLVDSIRQNDKYNLIGLIDDDSQKWGTILNSETIHPPDAIPELVQNRNLKLVFLAIPSLSRSLRRALLKMITQYPVEVRELPGLEKIIDGNISVDNVVKVEVEDILGREPVTPIKGLLEKNITGKSVLVTGAGGSIGSELCRQILELKPEKLVLLERSEFNLYSVTQEGVVGENSNKVIPILGSILNEEQVYNAMTAHKVQTVYHAAAYKHVPMVEINPIAGVWNNVIGTFRVATAAANADVESFVLISTDKAVRPTNVMGASKRFAELILQALNDQHPETCFTMVRFGNVLDSAGSVVPLFRKQIAEGGPVTVTHPEVLRYFMSIPEAVQLVIQAGAMADGGEVFVLDMGSPVKILDLAYKMIYLCGLKPKDEEFPQGDIPVEITGLRPGEKLYEELLIGNNTAKTDHPRIMKAKEDSIDWVTINKAVTELRHHCNEQDRAAVISTLRKFVKEYTPYVAES
ncbi:MAG: polysaccharide biosynthesis protein [FCB group bacterium]|nr:polysaccharide biosynthesis protein [FCB group bacterium]